MPGLCYNVQCILLCCDTIAFQFLLEVLHWCYIVASSVMLQASVTIQKHVRGHAVRQLVMRQSAAATQLQSSWRRHQALVAYHRMHLANLRLQAWARGGAARMRYKRIRVAVITLQVC